MLNSTRGAIKYVYDLPYTQRMELCRILDQSDKWEILGGRHMNFDMLTIQALRREVCCGRSPTDELLTRWGHQNHTILELFVHLSKMQHYQAMLTIKQFVDVEYHRLIYEGEANLSRIFRRATAPPPTEASTSTTNSSMINFNQTNSTNIMPSKMQGVPCDSESKILNVDANQRNTETLTTVLTSQNNNNINNSQRQSTSPKASTARASDRSDLSIGVESVGLPMIPFKELESATNGWDPTSILGKGGFGTVYRGLWKNTPVAVKRTRSADIGDSQGVQIQQILGELRNLNACRHDNILPLYGYSVGGDDPCLIYQLMPNGSLEDRLLCRQASGPLLWGQRLNIAVGTARGLQFLHTINEKPLIHGDIKSANILLDANFQPKIGDFGLAREGPQSQYTHMKVSRVHGTRPYLPDEFLRAKKFSTKVDTHSFGIVLFEISTGLRAYDDQRAHKFLRDLIENSTDAQLVTYIDRRAGPEEPHTYGSFIELGKLCVSRRPKDRPEMVQVLQELESVSTRRENMIRAQSLALRNSLTPSNPYEIQLLHDHLTIRRQASPCASPVLDQRPSLPDRQISPIPRLMSPLPRLISPTPLRQASPSPDRMSPLPRQSSPLSPLANSPEPAPVTNPFLVMNGGALKISAVLPTVLPSAGSHGVNSGVASGSDLLTNVGVDPKLLPTVLTSAANNSTTSAVLQEGISTPKIAVSPPSNQSEDDSAILSDEEEISEARSPVGGQSTATELSEESQYSYIIPLISELGIKRAEETEPAPSTSVAAPAPATRSPSSAKGKSLWILGETG